MATLASSSNGKVITHKKHSLRENISSEEQKEYLVATSSSNQNNHANDMGEAKKVIMQQAKRHPQKIETIQTGRSTRIMV